MHSSNFKRPFQISGIQQIGIGVENADQAFQWYKRVFGMDVVVFKDKAMASLMTCYTGGEVHERYAILAMNLQGGGGFEIWQYMSRKPKGQLNKRSPQDLGILWVKIRSARPKEAFIHMKNEGVQFLTGMLTNSEGKYHFFVKDPYENIFEVIEDDYVFDSCKSFTGGVLGVGIGVSNIEMSQSFYNRLLGYDKVLSEETGRWKGLGEEFEEAVAVQRVVLTHSQNRAGAFAKLLGPTQIELICHPEISGRPMFENRYWGDLGFIHVCFDITGMKELESLCESIKHPLTVNSNNSFDMGEAAGQFAYNEDCDGTLIEYVETHKVPILKSLGWYLNLKNRNPEKPLPNWMVKSLRFSRVK
ncbi:MAG: VOC family protein [Chitinophagaceae bacterium]|nr:VOC family protein [Chitinophagaceae bacterium]